MLAIPVAECRNLHIFRDYLLANEILATDLLEGNEWLCDSLANFFPVSDEIIESWKIELILTSPESERLANHSDECRSPEQSVASAAPSSPVRQQPQMPKKPPDPQDIPNPGLPIVEIPSEQINRVGWVMRTLILARNPQMIRDRKYHLHTYRKCMVGTEMVDWILSQGNIHSRSHAIAMWQVILEEGVIAHVTEEHHFKDKYLFYRFRDDKMGVGTMPSLQEKKDAEEVLQDTLALMLAAGPDAMMRMILRKPSHERTLDDLELIYEELVHIKALSHLSNSVKRELASVVVFESHQTADAVPVFHQGDEGKSWYIIIKGSVNVVIYGKGVVCTLHEGDDFGKLALMNDAPRAATIVLRDDNCHFLRVDKEDFNRIVRDVEANTVRLKEHGQDVLVLEKIPTSSGHSTDSQSHYKYAVMAGTPQKMLEHLLETRIDSRTEISDVFLEDFFLTHSSNTNHETDFITANKRRVVTFVVNWVHIIRDAVFDDSTTATFLDELNNVVRADSRRYNLQEEVKTMSRIIDTKQKFVEDRQTSTGRKWKLQPSGHLVRVSRSNGQEDGNSMHQPPMRQTDDVIFKVYCADHTYGTLKMPLGATAEMIKRCAADKLGLKDDLLLVEVKSTGERVVFKDTEVSIPTGLSLNGRIFITPRDHVDALTPLAEQDGPTEGTATNIEMFSSRDLAFHLMAIDWDLFSNVHEYEMIYHVFGRHQFRRIMSNLDVFLRRFNEVQYWIATEMCLTKTLSKRVQLIRKFIKMAAYCRDFQNLNAFFAIVMGLNNVAVSRLSQTWEKLPSKFKKMFSEFETLIDPSRNHRVYRITMAKMAPPIIPFMPLLIKDMTFTHEGNKTYYEGLVNFEKMHMLAQTLRTIRHCRSQPFHYDEALLTKNDLEIRQFLRNLSIIENPRILTQLSHKLEPRRG
uniref:Rap guanine nucleotide exchange factor 4 n=1 Tax=Strigamia maritima TaxID=126957 RepID=T1JAB1_STRMM